MKKKRIVVTGIGAVSALGHSVDAIFAQTKGQATSLEGGVLVPLNDKLAYLAIKELDSSEILSERQKRKIDLFSVYGLCASSMALDSSHLLESDFDKERVGIFVGNCLGGWGYTEPELKSLHLHGVEAMGPYVATAWFPAGLQGQISLAYGFKGFSKTFSASNVAGLQTIGYAAEAIQNDRVDVVVCGASEDLSSPYIRAILTSYESQGEFNNSVFGVEKPQNFAEGAAFLVIESYEHAYKRGAPIYCEIIGFSDHFCFHENMVESTVKRNIATAINNTSKTSHLLVLDGLLKDEPGFTQRAYDALNASIHMTDVKSKFGNMFSVSGVMEAACAAYGMKNGELSNSCFEFGIDDNNDVMESILIQRISSKGGITMVNICAP